MRYLHPIAPHELFVASGEYRYTRNSQPMAVIEKWTIHELPGGALFYRVDEDGRDEDGLTILSEALINPAGQLERFNVQSFNPLDSAIKLFKADYSFYPTYVQIGYRLQGQEHEYHEFDLIEDCAVYIKQTLYMGLTIRAVLALGGTAHVFAPQLISVQESQLQKLSIKSIGTESIAAGRKTIEAHKYQIADDVFYWIDRHHIPLKREFTHNALPYIVTLTNYAHR